MAGNEREFPLTDPESVERLRFQMERYVFHRSITGYQADSGGMELHLSGGGVIRFECRERDGNPGVDVILLIPVTEPESRTEVIQ